MNQLTLHNVEHVWARHLNYENCGIETALDPLLDSKTVGQFRLIWRSVVNNGAMIL